MSIICPTLDACSTQTHESSYRLHEPQTFAENGPEETNMYARTLFVYVLLNCAVDVNDAVRYLFDTNVHAHFKDSDTYLSIVVCVSVSVCADVGWFSL